MFDIFHNVQLKILQCFHSPCSYTLTSETRKLLVDPHLSHSLCLGLIQGQEVLGVSDSASEVSVSCSSTDDTTSLCQPSSSAESSEEVRRRGGDAAEEAKDRVTEVPLHSALLRSSVRSQSPFRRHSWGPGKNQAGAGDMNQRRYFGGWNLHLHSILCP